MDAMHISRLLHDLVSNCYPSARRRQSAYRTLGTASEALESRCLLTVDLTIGTYVPSFQDADRDEAGVVAVRGSIMLEQRNLGNTSADLTGGTPADETDNVVIQYFVSSDATLDGGDILVGEFNSGSFNTSISAGGSRTSTQISVINFTPGPSANFLLAKIDGTNVLAETDETNNVAVLDIRTPTILTTGNGSTVRVKKVTSLDPSLGFLDGESANYNGGQIAATFTDPQPKEFLQIFKNGRGSQLLKVSKNQLKIGGRVVGTVTGNKTSSLTVDFTADIDQFDVQRVLRSIGIKVLSDSPGERNFTFSIKDPDNRQSNVASKVVTIDFD